MPLIASDWLASDCYLEIWAMLMFGTRGFWPFNAQCPEMLRHILQHF